MVEREPGDDPRELILLAKNGNEAAFERLYDLYYNPVFRYLFIRTKEKRQAEDLTQAVFIKVYNTIGRFELTSSDPLSFFFTVARTTLIDHFRKEKHSPVFDDEVIKARQDNEHDPHNHANIRESEDVIRQAMRELTEDQKEIITLKFLNDLSNKEIAEITGKKEEAIRQLQLRALRKLRDYFKNEELL